MATGDDIIRYRADWTSQDAIEYRIDIIDTQYLGQPYNLEIGMDAMDGFTLDYQGGNSGRFNPILPSECIVNRNPPVSLRPNEENHGFRG